MHVDSGVIHKLLAQAGLGKADEIRPLGHGELNNSYRVRIGSQRYCVRIAKYQGKPGLAREADALTRLPVGIAPRLVYFDSKAALNKHLWIIETFIPGTTPTRLNLDQFHSLGGKLARIHAIPAPDKDVVDKGEVTGERGGLWDQVTWNSRSFYSEKAILHEVPDKRLQAVIPRIKQWLDHQDKTITIPARKYLLHKDVTPSNVLVRGNDCYLIDWELRGFGDPMSDFSTGFWDFDLNGGKWRIKLTEFERHAIYDGYTTAGGVIDTDRIEAWTVADMLGVALYLCHRIHSPAHDTTHELQRQYALDLDAIISSLNKLAS